MFDPICTGCCHSPKSNSSFFLLFFFLLWGNKIVRFCIWSVLQTHISGTYMLTVLICFKIHLLKKKKIHSDIFKTFINYFSNYKTTKDIAIII